MPMNSGATFLCCFAVFILSVSQALADSSGSWGPWSECSKSCDGVQTQEWQCSVGSACDNKPTANTRKCNEHGCLTHEMLIAIIAIAGVVLLLFLAILLICITRRHKKEKIIRKQKRSRYGPETVENGQNKPHGSMKRRQSFHHFPSSQNGPSTRKEGEEAEAKRVELQKTEALQSEPPSSDKNTVYEVVNRNYNSLSSRSYQESIQETQAIFGPDTPDDLGSVLDSSSMTSRESGSSDDNDEIESPSRSLPRTPPRSPPHFRPPPPPQSQTPVVEIIYSTVKK